MLKESPEATKKQIANTHITIIKPRAIIQPLGFDRKAWFPNYFIDYCGLFFYLDLKFIDLRNDN